MRKLLVLIILLAFSASGYSQDRLGVDLGISQPFTYYHYSPSGLLSGTPISQTPVPKPSLGLSYERKVGSHIFLGARLDLQTYSFKRDSTSYPDLFNLFGGSTNTYGTNVAINSSYLFLSPVFDLAIGRHQYVHINVSPGIGFKLNATQSTRVYHLQDANTVSDTTYNSSQYVNSVIFVVRVGFVEHIPINKVWHITITENAGFMPEFCRMSDPAGTNGLTIAPNNFSLQVGVMRKYRRGVAGKM